MPFVRATLGHAAWDGDILQVHNLLLMHGEVNARDANGQLILNICIQQQHEPIIRLLLDRGADFDLQDEGTLMTPMNNSIIMGNKALTRRLIKKGADVNLADGEGMTPLLWASMRGYLELVAQLIEYGADVNHQDIEGWTSLHIVCFKGYVDLLDYVLMTGTKAF
jgi:ankyrin repeat protein